MVSKLYSRKNPIRVRKFFFYLLTDSIQLLEADLWSPLMFIKIGMLFSIIRLVRVWCGILIRAAGLIENGFSFEC